MSTDSAGGDAPFPDERAPLLGEPSIAGDDSILSEHRVPAHIARRLFVSHFLSTWNSRLFEFGAVLYLATIFPGTLLIMSVYALVRGLSAILFAPAVGQYIDRGNRLQVVRVSIGKYPVVHASHHMRYTLTYPIRSPSKAWCSSFLRRLLRPCSPPTPWPRWGYWHAGGSLLFGLHRKALFYHEPGFRGERLGPLSYPSRTLCRSLMMLNRWSWWPKGTQ